MTEWFDFGKFRGRGLTRFLPLAHRTLMIGAPAAAYALGMNLKSRAARLTDCCAGCLGLFLIGLIGWWCDRFGGSEAVARSAPRVDSGVHRARRFVD
jgi:hypothetical protein